MINEVTGVLLELANIYFIVDCGFTRIVNPEFEPPSIGGSGRGAL